MFNNKKNGGSGYYSPPPSVSDFITNRSKYGDNIFDVFKYVSVEYPKKPYQSFTKEPLVRSESSDWRSILKDGTSFIPYPKPYQAFTKEQIDSVITDCFEDPKTPTLLTLTNEMKQEIEKSSIGKYNIDKLLTEKNYFKKDNNTTIKFITTDLKYTDDNKRIKFINFLRTQNKILELIYNIYQDKSPYLWKDSKYLWKKDQDTANTLQYNNISDKEIKKLLKEETKLEEEIKSLLLKEEISEKDILSEKSKLLTTKILIQKELTEIILKKKEWIVKDLIKYLRNFQVIMMKKIYDKIRSLYSEKQNPKLEDFKIIIEDETKEFIKFLKEKDIQRFEELLARLKTEINLDDFKKLLKEEKKIYKIENEDDELENTELYTRELNILKEYYNNGVIEKFVKKENVEKFKELLKKCEVDDIKMLIKNNFEYKKLTSDEQTIIKQFFEENGLYMIITHHESKIKYIYKMFMDYLTTIYINEIIYAFKNIEDNSKFNMFNIIYLKIILSLKNNIFYHSPIDKNIFDYPNEELKTKYQTKIEKLNEIINKINDFIGKLYTDEFGESTKNLGMEILNITNEDEYKIQLKEILFLSNIFVNVALDKIIPESYDSKIITSPAKVLGDNHDLCDIIKKIPNLDETKENIKVLGNLGNIRKYQLFCPTLYEASDYLYLLSPITKFMLFYWSPLINTYLTERSITDDNNVLIWDEKVDSYTDTTKLFSHKYSKEDLINLLKNELYLGYIKITLQDKNRLIFMFIVDNIIKLYDIYGLRIIYGQYHPYSFITSQEIILLLRNKLHMYKIDKIENKNYYLMAKTDYGKLKGLVEDDTDLFNKFNYKNY